MNAKVNADTVFALMKQLARNGTGFYDCTEFYNFLGVLSIDSNYKSIKTFDPNSALSAPPYMRIFEMEQEQRFLYIEQGLYTEGIAN